jgi:hypothetical protein
MARRRSSHGGNNGKQKWNTTGENCGYRGVGHSEPAVQPETPTHIRGGSERVAVYAARAVAKQRLFHPGDGPITQPDLN